MTPTPDTARLRLAGSAPAPIDALARALVAFQKLVYVLAGDQADKKRHAVMASPAPAGFLLRVGPAQQALSLGLGDAPAELVERLVGVLVGLAAGDTVPLRRALGDAERVAAFLKEVEALLPRAGEGWAIAVAGPDGAEATLDATTAAFVAARARPAPQALPTRLTLTGELLGVDFTRATFSLRDAASGKLVAGPYAPAQEVWLLKHRRKTIQVCCTALVDAAGLPRKVQAVHELRPVDLSPVSLAAFAWDAGALRLEPPLTVTPALTEAGYAIDDPEWGLAVRACDREGLEEALRDRLRAIWEALTAGALDDRAVERRWRRRLVPAPMAEAGT